MRPCGGARPLDPRVHGLGVSATLATREQAEAFTARGIRIFRLGLGQSPFPVPAPVVEALRAAASEKDYLPVRGLAALRSAVADYHRRRHAIARTAQDIMIGPGSKELMFLLMLCFDGEVVVPTPAWVSYAPQARLASRELRFVPTSFDDGFRLRPQVLDAICREAERPRLLVLNYPGNPTGTSYAPPQLAELAAVCREHGVVVLSDEIYGELDFGAGHVSIARYYEEGTIVSSGLSKWCGAGGWRLGTFCFPPELSWLLDALAAAGSETYSTTSAPVQHAAVRAFRMDERMERYLRGCRRILGTLLPWAAGELRAAGARVVEPAGGFYLFPDLEPVRAKLSARGIRDDGELALALLRDTGVSCLPGTEFGMPAGSLFLRLALVDFDGARALGMLDAHDLDEGFLRAHLAPVHEAIRRIRAYVESLGATEGARASTV